MVRDTRTVNSEDYEDVSYSTQKNLGFPFLESKDWVAEGRRGEGKVAVHQLACCSLTLAMSLSLRHQLPPSLPVWSGWQSENVTERMRTVAPPLQNVATRAIVLPPVQAERRAWGNSYSLETLIPPFCTRTHQEHLLRKLSG